MSGLLHTGDENDWSDLGLDGGGFDRDAPANGGSDNIRELGWKRFSSGPTLYLIQKWP